MMPPILSVENGTFFTAPRGRIGRLVWRVLAALMSRIGRKPEVRAISFNATVVKIGGQSFPVQKGSVVCFAAPKPKHPEPSEPWRWN